MRSASAFEALASAAAPKITRLDSCPVAPKGARSIMVGLRLRARIPLGDAVNAPDDRSPKPDPCSPAVRRSSDRCWLTRSCSIASRMRSVSWSGVSPGRGWIGRPNVTVVLWRRLRPRPLGITSAVPSMWTGTIGALAVSASSATPVW